jgi:hypothetical protein
MKIRQLNSLILVAFVSIISGIGGAYAATQTVTATIKFLSDLTITQTTAPNFGYVKAATAATYVLSTAGAVTGGTSEGGAPAAGSYTLAGSATQLINISAGGYTANGASTPSLATCKYNGVAIAGADCTGAGLAASGPLLVGLTVTTTAAGADGVTNTPSFTLTVVYQ